MKPEMTVRAMTKAESMYCYTQSQQIMGQSGCIGHLRADMGSSGDEFYSRWEDHNPVLNTQEFKNEFNQVIDALRARNQILSNRQELSYFCYSTPGIMLPGTMGEFGIRLDTKEHSYMMRLNPNRGEYSLYCYCYDKAALNSHLRNAERGIRFITSSYKELFRIPDGGVITIKAKDGKQNEMTCRFIDDYHFEAHSTSGTSIFHICEFAERIERTGSKICEGKIKQQEVNRDR